MAVKGFAKFRRRGKGQLVLSDHGRWSDTSATIKRRGREEELEAMLSEAMPDEKMPRLESWQVCGLGEGESEPEREWMGG